MLRAFFGCRFAIAFVGIAVLASATGLVVAQDLPTGARKIDFRKDVAPILQQQCVDCHGPELQMAELRLDQRRFVLGSDADPELVKTGKSEGSLLIRRLVDPKLGLIMPPKFPFPPSEKVGLSESAIQVLRAWIDQGADWPAGVSLASEAISGSMTAQAKALFTAIRAGDQRAVAEQLKGDQGLVNSRNHQAETLLMHAAALSDAAMVRLLLEQGADVNLASREGATALLRAAGEYDKVQLLLDRGAKIDVKSSLGRTPLLVAAAYPGNAETVRLLLARGAKINEPDVFGETCLMSASKRGDVELVKLLLEAGAEIGAGSQVFGRPALTWAAEEGNLETLTCLLEHGAGKNQTHLNDALASAVTRGPIGAVRLLIEHGANVNLPSFEAVAYTPLMWAAYSETADVATIQLLLEKGADPHAKGVNGETALSLAKKRGHTAVVELLERAGGR